MKKFIIVIVFVFLIALLISFNYLLWDREKQLENFQDISDSKNFTIDTLAEKNNSLDKLNKELTGRINDLNTQLTDLRKEYFSLSDENLELYKQVANSNDLIIQFKKNLNTAPINDVIKKWFEAISTQNFKVASTMISKNSQDSTINDFESFSKAYLAEVKAIHLKSSKLFTDLVDSEHLGKIQVKVSAEVEKPVPAQDKTPVPSNLFKSGINEKYITVEFDSQSNGWLILEVSDKP
jgi:cell division protein FtsB